MADHEAENLNESPIFDDLVSTSQPQDLTVEQEGQLIEQSVFPPEEFDLPDQTPEDLGKTDEEAPE